eukprot:scaffold166461_cov43-Prasinocladus_malaysianus.AAC.2
MSRPGLERALEVEGREHKAEAGGLLEVAKACDGVVHQHEEDREDGREPPGQDDRRSRDLRESLQPQHAQGDQPPIEEDSRIPHARAKPLHPGRGRRVKGVS